jgi:hypothetical protein
MVVKVIVVAMIRNNGNSGDFRKILYSILK